MLAKVDELLHELLSMLVAFRFRNIGQGHCSKLPLESSLRLLCMSMILLILNLIDSIVLREKIDDLSVRVLDIEGMDAGPQLEGHKNCSHDRGSKNAVLIVNHASSKESKQYSQNN